MRTAELQILQRFFMDGKHDNVLKIGVVRERLDDEWAKAVVSIQEYLRDEGFQDVNVKIFDPRPSEDEFLNALVREGDVLLPKWESVRMKVEDILVGETSVRLLRLARRTYFEEAMRYKDTNTPFGFPIVEIVVDGPSTENWRVVADEIGELLDQEGLEEVGVIIEIIS